jgi:hypothetical protein
MIQNTAKTWNQEDTKLSNDSKDSTSEVCINKTGIILGRNLNSTKVEYRGDVLITVIHA